MFVARSTQHLRRSVLAQAAPRRMALRQFSESPTPHYGAKPGYIKWKPIPDPLPGVDRPVYWGTELLTDAGRGVVWGIVLGAIYVIWKARLVNTWGDNMREFIHDYHKSKVVPRREQLTKERETPWWDRLSPDNKNDLEEMKRFIWATSAKTDDERFEILNMTKAWDVEAENNRRDQVLNFSEYPNYFLAEMPELEDEGDDDEDDDE